MNSRMSSFLRASNLFYVSCFMILILSLGLRLHFISEKIGFHEDENLSIILCNYKDLPAVVSEGNEFTGKQIKDSAYFSSDSIADAFSDVKKIYLENNDRPHTNLYYSSLRLWFAGVVATDFKKIIKHGCRLNLLFFLLSFFFLYKLLRKLFNDEKMVVLGLCIAFINTGTISNTLFLRPYQQQETFLIIFTYLCLKIYEDIKCNKFLVSFSCYLKIFFIVALTLLTGYFAAIYVLMFFVLLTMFAEKNNIEAARKKMSVLFFGSVVTACILFPAYLKGFSSHRAAQGFRVLGIDLLFHNFINSMNVYLFDIILIHLFPPLIFVLLCFVIFYNREYFYKQKNHINISLNIPLIISVICFVWSFGVMFLAPYKELRYCMSCFPLLLLIVPYIIDSLNVKTKKIAALFIMSFAFFYVSFCGPNVVQFMYKQHVKCAEDFNSGAHLSTVLLITQKWQYALFLHFLNDECRYTSCYSIKSLQKKLLTGEEFVVIFADIEEQVLEKKLLEECLQKNFNIKECVNDRNYTKYVVKKKND